MLRSTLYIIILSVAFSGIILSLIVVLAENIEKYEAQEEYLEEYKQWAKSVKDYSDNLKLQVDSLTAEKSAMSEEYDSLYIEYEDLFGSKQALQKKFGQEKMLFKQEKSSFDRVLQSQQRELESQEKELEQLERAQIEEMVKTNPLVSGLIDGQLRFYIEPVPDYAASKVKVGVTRFSDELENYQFYTNVKFKRVYNLDDAHIQISWIKNYGSHVLGESIFKSVVKVGLGSDNCYGDWQPFDAPTVLKIFWHELGHSMGFGHSNDPNNILYYKTDTKFVTDYDETLALGEGEYYTLPFCNGGTMQYQVSSEDQYNGFYVYVLPPETDSKNFIELGVGQYYPNCSTENLMTKYGETCNVPAGAKLVIYNLDDPLNFDVMRIDTKIINLNERKVPDLKWDISQFEYDEAWLNQIWNMYH